MRKLLLLIAALWAVPVHSFASPTQDAQSVLEGVSNIQWLVTPAQAMSELNEKTTVVWVGRVLDLVPSHQPNGETILDFYCAFLPLQNPSAKGLVQPIVTKPETEQVFLVSLRSPAFPIEQATKLRLELKEKTHFVVVAGWPFQVAQYGNHPIVQIGAYKAIFSDKLALTTMPSASTSAAQPGGSPDSAPAALRR